MEVISNADIARLILGYLNEQCLKKASLAFLKTSPYLKQEYKFLKRGFKPLSLGPESLITIIREYCRIKSRVLLFVESLDVENRYDFIEQASLEGKYQVLLKGYKHKPCSISTNKHEREKQKRRYSSPDTETTIDSSKINLAKRRRLSTHFVTLHNTNVDIRSNAHQDFSSSKDSASDSDHETGTKNCPPEVLLEVPDFNEISETRLQNSVVQNKLTETINSALISKIPSEVSKVVKTPENGKENLQNLNYQRQTPANGSNVTTQTIFTAAVNEPTPIVCKNSISNTYELLIFSETQLPTGQYMYTPIDKPVSIDPRTGEIAHIIILKCMDKNITSVEFAPNVPNNINSCFEQDIQSQKTIQILSDEVIQTQQMTNHMNAFPPVEDRPQNNIQLEVTGNLDPTPGGQRQEIEIKATPPSSTQRKRSHVRNLNFTSPLKVLSKKEEPIKLSQLVEPLAVIEPPKSKALNIENFVPEVSSEVANITEKTEKASEDKSTRSKISDTPKSSFPANTRGRVNTRQAAKKVKTEATEIKPNRVLKGERKQRKTKKDKNPAACEKVVVIENNVVEKPSMPSIDTTRDSTAKLPKTSTADIKIVHASSLKQNHEPSKSNEYMKIQEMKEPDKTLNQWKEMRQIPRNQMDQHLRKISSELEEKRKAILKASKRTMVTKKKTDISAEKNSSKLTSKNQKKACKRSESTKQDEPDVQIDQVKEEELSNLIISKQNQDNVLLSCTNQEIHNAIEEKTTTIQGPSPVKVSPNNFSEKNKLPEKLVDKCTEVQSAKISEEKLSNLTTNDRETIEGNTSQNQIQDMSVDQQLTESFICSALLSLETPFKMDHGTNPKTPCVKTPGSLTTPIFKNVTYGGNYSLLKNPDVPTPILAITPGKGLTPFQRSGGSSRYSVRPTDYSSGSSYYKPDECDELDKNFDTNYHKERLQKISEEEQHSIPATEEKSEDKEQYNSDEWSKSLDTVQTVIKAKKFEPRIGDILDGEKEGGTKISPCKLETRLSDTESSSSKTTNKSVGSSSRSSSSSSSSSASSSDDDESHQTKEEIKSKSYCDKNSNIATKIVVLPKGSKVEKIQSNISSSHAKMSMPILDKLTSSKRTSKVSATVTSHFQDLEEKRKRVVNKIKGHETKDITPHHSSAHQKTHIGKKKPTAVPVNKNLKQNHIDSLNQKTETRSLSLKIVDHKDKPQTNREHNVLPKDEEQRLKGIEVVKIKDQSGNLDAKKLATPMKMSSRLIQEMLENDFALTPSKDNISVDDSASVDDKDFVEVEVLHVLDPLVNDNECDENIEATAQVKQGLEVIVERKQDVIQETTNNDSEEEEYVDAYGACQVLTYGEEDKDRFISMVYNEKNAPPNVRRTKLSISGQIMNIFLEGLPHKITVEPEIKLFEMIPESIVKSNTKTTKAIKEKQSLTKTKTKVLQIIESERKRIGDPCDSCQAVTFDEDDKKRFIKIHYKGKNDTVPGRKKKLSLSDSVMPILVDGILHKLNVQKEVELLKMKPSITKSKKTVITKHQKPVQEELEDTHTLLTTSTPIKPKIKLLHKNRFNKPENDPSIKSGLSKKNPCPTTDGFESSQDYQPTPSSANDLDQQGNGHSQILPLNAENIKKVLSQTKLENKTSIGAEDINAVLSHLHGN